jgi:hypothetical protein
MVKFVDWRMIKILAEPELKYFCQAHGLQVDLAAFPTLGRKQGAVIDAAEKAGILFDDDEAA